MIEMAKLKNTYIGLKVGDEEPKRYNSYVKVITEII